MTSFRALLSIALGALLLSSACKDKPKEKEAPPKANEVAEPTSEPTSEPAKPTPAAEPASETVKVVAAGELEWKPVPNENGLELAMVHTDPKTKGMTGFVRVPAGWKGARHFHPTGFSRLVIDGDFEVTFADGTKIASGPGDYVRGGANAIHESMSKGGATLMLVTDEAFGSIQVGEDDKPTKPGDAPLGEATEKAAPVAFADIKYNEVPNSGGVQLGKVWENAETKAMAAFLKVPAGFSMGKHAHSSNFHRVILDGEFAVTTEDGETHKTKKGDYLRGVAMLAHTAASESGTTFFLVTDGEFGTVPKGEGGKPVANEK